MKIFHFIKQDRLNLKEQQFSHHKSVFRCVWCQMLKLERLVLCER